MSLEGAPREAEPSKGEPMHWYEHKHFQRTVQALVAAGAVAGVVERATSPHDYFSADPEKSSNFTRVLEDDFRDEPKLVEQLLESFNLQADRALRLDWGDVVSDTYRHNPEHRVDRAVFKDAITDPYYVSMGVEYGSVQPDGSLAYSRGSAEELVKSGGPQDAPEDIWRGADEYHMPNLYYGHSEDIAAFCAGIATQQELITENGLQIVAMSEVRSLANVMKTHEGENVQLVAVGEPFEFARSIQLSYQPGPSEEAYARDFMLYEIFKELRGVTVPVGDGAVHAASKCYVYVTPPVVEKKDGKLHYSVTLREAIPITSPSAQ